MKMKSERERIADKVSYWMGYGLKMGRVKEILRKIRLLSSEKLTVTKVGETVKDSVENYNSSIGQKV